MDNLLILVTYHAKPGQGRAFLSELAASGLRDKVLAETGCLRYDYYLADGNDDEILLIEMWLSARHQSVHMAQPHMQMLAALKETYIEATDVKKYTV